LAIPRDTPLVVLRIGTNAPRLSSNPVRRRLHRWLHRRADAVVGVSHEALAAAVDLGLHPTTQLRVIRNGRDPAQFHPPPEQDRTNRSTPGILFAGELVPGKRPDIFLDVVERLRSTSVTFGAAMAGDGPLRATLAVRAGNLGVEMLGPRSDMDAVMREFDVFLFTSDPPNEGLPGVLVEAAMSGMAIVTTAVPGARDVVTDGVSGLLVASTDADAIAERTRQLLVDPELRLRLGAAAWRHASANLDRGASVDTWRQLLGPGGVSRRSRPTLKSRMSLSRVARRHAG
jgi:glycosyltransferase involved in cell wall biosynthesis